MDSSSVVPLFLPSNYKWNQLTRKVEINSRKPRGDIKICQEGLHLIKSIQNEPVVVVCITGPARSGKSYFLSQMQDGVNFEIGHSTTSKTTGVWIALCPRFIEVNGTTARLVLMDAEGLGSTSTVDHGQDDKWEHRVFSLCALLSSYLIYNSTGIPNSDDLDKLGFIAQFSSAIHSGSHYAERDGPPPATGHFRQVAPHFLWLVRDALLIPEINGAPCDWKTYVENEVLSVRDGEAKSRRSSVCRAITGTFQSFDAFGLPPPSVDPYVIRNLLQPENRGMINPNFISGIEELKTIISSKHCLKAIYGCPVTGLQMAKSLPSIVAAVNRECDKLHIDSMWDTVVKTQMKKNVKQAQESYHQSVSRLRLPAEADFITAAHDRAVKKAKAFFHKQSQNFNQDISCKYVDKLSKSFEKSYVELTGRNEKESRRLCEKAMKDLLEEYFTPYKRDIEDKAFRDLLKAKQNIFKIYSRRARGPLANDIRKEAEESLVKDMVTLGHIIMQATTKQVNNMYKDEMKVAEDDVPLEDSQLDDIHSKGYSKCQDFFETKCGGCEGFYKSKKGLESDLLALYQSYRKSNYERSRKFCEDLMERLECHHLETVFTMLNTCKYSDLLLAKEKLFAEFDIDAKGPAKFSVRNKRERKINRRLILAQKPLVDAAAGDAERKYKALLEEVYEEGPHDAKDLQRKMDEKFDKVKSVFDIRREGIEDMLGQTSEEFLLSMKREQDKKYVRRHDDKSQRLCEELMKKLVAENLTPELKDVSLFVNFQKKKEIIMQVYDNNAKGPWKDSVREEYETRIDDDIRRGEEYRALKGVRMTLEASGILMTPVGGNVGKIGMAMTAASKLVKEAYPKGTV